jgi:hypothetical protein
MKIYWTKKDFITINKQMTLIELNNVKSMQIKINIYFFKKKQKTIFQLKINYLNYKIIFLIKNKITTKKISLKTRIKRDKRLMIKIIKYSISRIL